MPNTPDSPHNGAEPHLKDVLDAQQAGYDAAMAGKRANACPHHNDEDRLRRAWVAGYSAAMTDLREMHHLPTDHGRS